MAGAIAGRLGTEAISPTWCSILMSSLTMADMTHAS